MIWQASLFESTLDGLRVGLLVSLMACLGCSRATECEESNLRQAVTSEDVSPQLIYHVLRAAEKMGPEEELWLIGRLADVKPTVRSRAAIALSQAKSDGAAVALYLACSEEEDQYVRDALLGALGRLGDQGRPFLLSVLKREGISPMLAAALAQSCGVQPAPSRYGAYFVNDLQGWHWWETVGKKQFGRLIEPEQH
jgi:hypothetical protein